MKANFVCRLFSVAIMFTCCHEQQIKDRNDQVIGVGKMPAIAYGNTGVFHMVYGSGDSIMYISSFDKGESFSAPLLVAILPGLSASSMRGPQIATTTNGVIILACNKSGNIFSYTKTASANWSLPVLVNDVDSVAKEQFISLGADGNHAYAVWLDLRGNKRNKIVGCGSVDAGKTWSKNILVYTSPDSSVCECCKPSVAVHQANIYVMFRNWLAGNRDLYLIQSLNGGESFGDAKVLGTSSWPLNGCPMDGGGLAIDSYGVPQTVWRRKDSVYACTPGQPEVAVGTGRGCTIESVNNKNVYSWTENGEVIIRKSQGTKMNLGKGQLPIVKRINDEQILCVWENDKQIHAETISLKNWQ